MVQIPIQKSKVPKKINKTLGIGGSSINLACQLRYTWRSAVLYNKRLYIDTDEWIHHTNGGQSLISIAANAIEQLNETVYIEYQPEPEDKAEKGADLALNESVKATEAIKVLFDMIIVENNESLEEFLNALNEKSEEIWLIKVERKDDLFAL